MTGNGAIQHLVAVMIAYQEQRELSDKELADEIGCPRSTWTAMRLGHFTPGRKLLAKLTKTPRFKDAAMKALTS